jgi:hypothetical protein
MMVKKRTKALSAMFVALSAALLLTMSMSVAYAIKPEIVEGTFTSTFTFHAASRAGESDNVIANLSVNAVWSGDIQGSSTSDSRWVYHYLPPPWVGGTGALNAHGYNTMDATVDSKSGILFIGIEGRRDAGGAFSGTWVIIGGTDDLANLHGQGTWEQTGSVSAYTGQIHWDP